MLSLRTLWLDKINIQQRKNNSKYTNFCFSNWHTWLSLVILIKFFTAACSSLPVMVETTTAYNWDASSLMSSLFVFIRLCRRKHLLLHLNALPVKCMRYGFTVSQDNWGKELGLVMLRTDVCTQNVNKEHPYSHIWINRHERQLTLIQSILSTNLEASFSGQTDTTSNRQYITGTPAEKVKINQIT